jgi:hypothetical protein
MKSYVQPRRSLVKAITFREPVLCSDFAVMFLITHSRDMTFGLTIGTKPCKHQPVFPSRAPLEQNRLATDRCARRIAPTRSKPNWSMKDHEMLKGEIQAKVP